MNKGRIIILSGPSGVGKSTVIKKLLEAKPNMHFSVSVTTRAPRAGEIDGKAYYFVTQEQFDSMVEKDELLEHARYVGGCYGTPAKAVDIVLQHGSDVLLDIEVQGAVQVSKKRPDALKIFILPPSMDELKNRLRSRGANDETSIDRRIERAKEEMAMLDMYDYQVVNDDVDSAVQKILDIIDNR